MPDSALKIAAAGVERRCELWIFTSEIAVKPALRADENGMRRHFLRVRQRWKIFLPVESEMGQSFVVAGEQDLAKGRGVGRKIMHDAPSFEKFDINIVAQHEYQRTAESALAEKMVSLTQWNGRITSSKRYNIEKHNIMMW